MTSRRQPSEPAVMAAIEAGCRTLRLPTIRDRSGEIAAAAEREQLTYLGCQRPRETARRRPCSCPLADMRNCPLTVMGSARHDRRLPRRVPRLRPLFGCDGGAEAPVDPKRDKLKSAEEIMEMLEAFDLTGSLRDAAELAGCSHHTVAKHVAARDAGGVSDRAAARPQLIDEFLPKLEEWMEHSKGKIRADVAHDKLLALGYRGSERTTRRAVATVRAAFKAGRVRVHRPWVTEPGMWLQYDFGDGPGHRRGEDGAVLRVAGLVAVPGGAGVAGQDDAERVRRAGRDAAPARRGPDVCADRQREDRHRRACRRDRGA